MNWFIIWNDGTTSTWPVAKWSATAVLALRNVRDVALRNHDGLLFTRGAKA